MIRGHRRGEEAGEVDINLHSATVVDSRDFLLLNISMRVITGYILAFRFSFEVEPSLHQNRRTARLSNDILTFLLDFVHTKIYSRAFQRMGLLHRPGGMALVAHGLGS